MKKKYFGSQKQPSVFLCTYHTRVSSSFHHRIYCRLLGDLLENARNLRKWISSGYSAFLRTVKISPCESLISVTLFFVPLYWRAAETRDRGFWCRRTTLISHPQTKWSREPVTVDLSYNLLSSGFLESACNLWQLRLDDIRSSSVQSSTSFWALCSW